MKSLLEFQYLLSDLFNFVSSLTRLKKFFDTNEFNESTQSAVEEIQTDEHEFKSCEDTEPSDAKKANDTFIPEKKEPEDPIEEQEYNLILEDVDIGDCGGGSLCYKFKADTVYEVKCDNVDLIEQLKCSILGSKSVHTEKIW